MLHRHSWSPKVNPSDFGVLLPFSPTPRRGYFLLLNTFFDCMTDQHGICTGNHGAQRMNHHDFGDFSSSATYRSKCLLPEEYLTICRGILLTSVITWFFFSSAILRVTFLLFKEFFLQQYLMIHVPLMLPHSKFGKFSPTIKININPVPRFTNKYLRSESSFNWP